LAFVVFADVPFCEKGNFLKKNLQFQKIVVILQCKKSKTMATITLSYDGRSAAARKALDDLLALGLFSMKENTLIFRKDNEKKEEESPYNPEFVKKIKEVQASHGGVEIDLDNIKSIWEL